MKQGKYHEIPLIDQKKLNDLRRSYFRHTIENLIRFIIKEIEKAPHQAWSTSYKLTEFPLIPEIIEEEFSQLNSHNQIKYEYESEEFILVLYKPGGWN